MAYLCTVIQLWVLYQHMPCTLPLFTHATVDLCDPVHLYVLYVLTPCIYSYCVVCLEGTTTNVYFNGVTCCILFYLALVFAACSYCS